MYREEKLRPAGSGGVAVPFPAPGSMRPGTPRFARLFARTWSAYLEGWGRIVRSGYAPPGTLLHVYPEDGVDDLRPGRGPR